MQICIQEDITINTSLLKPNIGLEIKDENSSLIKEDHNIKDRKSYQYFNTFTINNKIREEYPLTVNARLEDKYNNSNWYNLPESKERFTYVKDLVVPEDVNSLAYYKYEKFLDVDGKTFLEYFFTINDTVLYRRAKDIKNFIKLKFTNRRNKPWFYNKRGLINGIHYLPYLDQIKDGKEILVTKQRFNETVSVSQGLILPTIDINNYIEVALMPSYNSKTTTELTIGNIKLLTYKNNSYGYEIDNIFKPYSKEDLKDYIILGIGYNNSSYDIVINHKVIDSVKSNITIPLQLIIEHSETKDDAITKLDNITIFKEYQKVKHFEERI